jgi:hypothetical protein
LENVIKGATHIIVSVIVDIVIVIVLESIWVRASCVALQITEHFIMELLIRIEARNRGTFISVD